MNKIYLVNIGANTGHSNIARSPLFSDGSFTFVSFPCDGGEPYPQDMRPFTREAPGTHLDPDWQNLTYGDCVENPRAAALKRAAVGDVLLFWGLLFTNSRRDWGGFTGEHGWYLLGVIRIGCIMEAGQRVGDLPERYRARARQNAHVGNGPLSERDRVFLGEGSRSGLFTKAVDLGAHSRDGLMFRAFSTAAGAPLVFGAKPHWRSSLRPCRCIFDLETDDGRRRAKLVDVAIRGRNSFQLI